MPAGQPVHFNVAAIPALRQSLAMDFVVQTGTEQSDLMVYPLSDSGYQFDYSQNGVQGTVLISPQAQADSRLYIHDFSGDSLLLDAATAIWLSRLNFSELQKNGETELEILNHGKHLFRVTGNSTYAIPLQDSILVVPVVELRSDSQNLYLSFVPDPQYPLIVAQETGASVKLMNVQNRLAESDDFDMGVGCHLHYRMVEAGVNEYKIELTCKSWSDTAALFAMHGSYSSASYSYEFNYDVVFREDAMRKPNFILPVFSALDGTMVYDKSNWILLNAKEIDSVYLKGAAYLSLPHYAENPEDDPESYEDDESREAAQRAFDDSYHTLFYPNRWGRIMEDQWYAAGRQGQEQVFASKSLFASDEGIELQVLSRSKYPLMLYFNDGQLYEISLEFAGYDE